MTDYSSLTPPYFNSDEKYHRWLDELPFYRAAEERAQLIEIRDRIFTHCDGGSGGYPDSFFRSESWDRVIIRGSLHGSDRSKPPTDLGPDKPGYAEMMEDWKNDDPRDELLPLLQTLYDDGVDEIIHACGAFVDGDDDFVGTPVNTKGLRCMLWSGYLEDRLGEAFQDSRLFFVTDTDRIIFDRTGRWGMYASCEEFGLLGGEPEFIARYVEKASGWDLIRERADEYWQMVVDVDAFEADWVEQYYMLAGWDNPPRKRES